MSVSSVIVRKNPESGESLAGYLIRIAEANGYPGTRWLGEAIGFSTDHRSIASLGGFLEPLSLLLGQPQEILEIMSFRAGVTSNASDLLMPPGYRIQRYEIDLRRPKVCADCLKQYGHDQIYWSLYAIQFCPEHGTALTEECGACGTKVSWGRGHVLPCNCFCSNTDELASENVMDLTRHIANVVLSSDRYPIANQFPKEFLELGLSDKLKVIAFLGMSRTGRFKIGLKAMTKRTLSEHREIVRHAANALADWPNGLERHFASFFERQKLKQDEFNLRDRHDSFYSYLIDPYHSSAFSFLRKELGKYISYHQPDVIITGRGDPGLATQQHYVSRYQAREEMKVSKWEVERAIRHGELETKSFRTSYGEKEWILKSSISKYLERKKYLFTLKNAAEYLSVAPAVIKEFIRWGILNPTHSRKLNESFRTYIDPKEIDELLARLRARIQQRKVPVYEKTSFLGASIMDAPGPGVAGYVHLALKGHLHLAPCKGKVDGFPDFQLYRSDVRYIGEIYKDHMDLQAGEWTFKGDVLPPSEYPDIQRYVRRYKKSKRKGARQVKLPEYCI